MATCWDLYCDGYGSYKYLKAGSSHNSNYIGTIDNKSRHKITTESLIQNSQPALTIHTGGYLFSKQNGNASSSGPVSYFEYPNGTYHIAGGWESTNHS